MTRTRVLRIIARMNVGGPALQVTALARHLDPARFDQRILVGDVAAGEADYIALRSPGLAVERVPGLGRAPRPTDDGRALASITMQIRRFQPHIVHTHTAKAGVLGRTAAMLARVPLRVHTFHGHLLQGYFSPPATRAVVLTERALARHTTRLVAVGQRVRDDLLAAGIGRPTQYLVIPPGVEIRPPMVKEAARAALGLPLEAPVIAFVGRLTRIKRPDRFVATATILRERFPDLVFVVGGAGEELEAMRRQAGPLGSSIRFLGWTAEVEILYAAADLVVLTSDNEGMPVSLIEAAALGCPAVTTDVGSAGEVVLNGVTGFVTDPSADAVAEAAARLLMNPGLRAQFSDAAAGRARELFSRERLVADMTLLYDELVRRERACGPS